MSVLNLGPGGHACLIYDSFNDQKQTVLPFIRDGLRDGDQCIYVANEQSDDDWCEEFQAYGIDVHAEREKGGLIVGKGARWRQSGHLTSIARAGQVWVMIEEALARRRGVRWVVDMGWTLECGMPPQALCHWEATLNPLIAGDQEVRILCQYNVNRHPAEAIHAALRTHPIAVVRGISGANPFYEAPRILEHEPHLNHSDVDSALIAGMLYELASVSK